MMVGVCVGVAVGGILTEILVAVGGGTGVSVGAGTGDSEPELKGVGSGVKVG